MISQSQTNCKKEYLNKTSTLLNLLCNEGVIPIFITITMPYKLHITEIENINEIIKKIKATTIKKETLSIYLYVCIEETKNKNVHFHCLWGLRNIIQNNNSLEISIKNELNNVFEDIWINAIYDKKNLNNKIYYLFKNKNIFIKNDDFCDKFNYVYIYSHAKYQNVGGDNFFSQLMDISDSENWNIIHENIENTNNNEFQKELVKTSSIYSSNQDDLTNLLILYLKYNNFYLYENDLYVKENDLEISYKKIDSIEIIIKEIDYILEFFEKLSIQLKQYNWHDFKLKNFNKIEEKITKIKLIYDEKIKLDFNLIEFKDCIINLNTSQKLTKTNKNNKIIKIILENKIGTNKFKKILYKNVKKPKIWVDLLKKVTENDEKNINTIKRFIKGIFLNIEYKKKVLYIFGKSNTFKTTLIGTPLLEYLGEENIGFLSSNSNFTFQDIENKKLLLLDEFKYEKKHKKNYLKLFEGTSILVEKKYKKASKEKSNIIFILTNDKLDDKLENDIEVLTAIKNRTEIIEFKEYTNSVINVEKLKSYIKENNIEIILWATFEKNDNIVQKMSGPDDNPKRLV